MPRSSGGQSRTPGWLARFVIVGWWLIAAAPVCGWHDALEQFLASLNSPEAQQELGLAEVSRPERFANHLNVVFHEDVPAERRAQALQKIGRQFLAILFEQTGISTVTILERDPSGAILNRAIVNLSGLPVTIPRRTS
jgi:hypothetical protein